MSIETRCVRTTLVVNGRVVASLIIRESRACFRYDPDVFATRRVAVETASIMYHTMRGKRGVRKRKRDVADAGELDEFTASGLSDFDAKRQRMLIQAIRNAAMLARQNSPQPALPPASTLLSATQRPRTLGEPGRALLVAQPVSV